VDWPPARSTSFPEGEKVGQDDGIGVQVSNATLPRMWIDHLREWSKKHGGSFMVSSRKGLLSPVQESEEISFSLGGSSIVSAAMSLCPPITSLAPVLNTRKLVNCRSVLEKVVKTHVD
jgi:hypothetical protein